MTKIRKENPRKLIVVKYSETEKINYYYENVLRT